MAKDYRWVLRFIDRLYDAAADDEIWPRILKDSREFLDCRSSTLFFANQRHEPIGAFFGDNVSPESIAAYQDHYHRVDIRLQRAVTDKPNRIVTDRDLVDEDIVQHHEFYQDFLRPIGLRYALGAVIDLEDGAFAIWAGHRDLRQSHADSDAIERAALIMPHVRRSLQLRRRLASVGIAEGGALEVLDRLGQAVFLIGGDGRIVWRNAGAEHLLRQRDGLIVGDGELRARSSVATTKLQGLILSAIRAPIRPKERPGGVMAVPRPSLKRSYQLLITPLSRGPHTSMVGDELPTSPSAAVFVMDPEETRVPRAELLATLYNLTPAETRLATALVSGTSLKAYAERSALSIHYVRWLLKQLEAKTDTRRIGDLIRLLARQAAFFGEWHANENGN